MYSKISVTYDGILLDQFDRKDSMNIVKAHILQVATIWNYGVNYERGIDGRPLSQKTQLFYNIILRKFWDLRPRYKASTSESIKYSKVDPNSPVEIFHKEVIDFCEA